MGKRDTAIYDRVLAKFGYDRARFRRTLSALLGKEVSRQREQGWKRRGIFPRDLIPHLAKLTRIPHEDFLSAQTRPRELSTSMQRVLAKFNGSPMRLARSLSDKTGRPISGQMVDGWTRRNRFPNDVVLALHAELGIPLVDLLGQPRKPQSVPPPDTQLRFKL